MDLRRAFLRWIAARLDKYVMEVYRREHDINAPPPAYRRRSSGEDVRRYVQADPSAIWEIFQEARRTSSSMEQVLLIRQKDDRAGGGPSSRLSTQIAGWSGGRDRGIATVSACRTSTPVARAPPARVGNSRRSPCMRTSGR